MLIGQFLPVFDGQFRVALFCKFEHRCLEKTLFILGPFFPDFVGLEARIVFEQAADNLATPFIRVGDPLVVIPFVFVDPMEEALMKIALRVYSLKFKLIPFDSTFDDWLARDVRVIADIELGTSRSKRRMLLRLTIMSAPSSQQQTGVTHLVQIPTRLIVTLYQSAVQLDNGVAAIACWKCSGAITVTLLLAVAICHGVVGIGGRQRSTVLDSVALHLTVHFHHGVVGVDFLSTDVVVTIIVVCSLQGRVSFIFLSEARNILTGSLAID
jgi:hypothetical protein